MHVTIWSNTPDMTLQPILGDLEQKFGRMQRFVLFPAVHHDSDSTVDIYYLRIAPSCCIRASICSE